MCLVQKGWVQSKNFNKLFYEAELSAKTIWGSKNGQVLLTIERKLTP
jgi:hypothetical protein